MTPVEEPPTSAAPGVGTGAGAGAGAAPPSILNDGSTPSATGAPDASPAAATALAEKPVVSARQELALRVLEFLITLAFKKKVRWRPCAGCFGYCVCVLTKLVVIGS